MVPPPAHPLMVQTPAHTTPATVVLVAGNRLLLESLPEQGGPLTGVQIVGRALDLAEGREIARRTAPRVLLVDGPNFCQGFRELGEDLTYRLGQLHLAIFADGFTDAQLDLAVSIGARGLLTQHDSLADLAAALSGIAGGERRVSALFQDRILHDGRGGHLRVHRRHRLRLFSRRQLDVLMQLAEGRRVKDIAEAMQLSEKAIESHKYRLMNRLGIHDRVELCRWAIREGLISA
jgi:DNA-binding NarL/FixJ family response regulator